MKKFFLGFVSFLCGMFVFHTVSAQYIRPIVNEKDFYQAARTFINESLSGLFDQEALFEVGGFGPVTHQKISTNNGQNASYTCSLPKDAGGTPVQTLEDCIRAIRDRYNGGGRGQDSIEDVQALFEDMTNVLDTIEKNSLRVSDAYPDSSLSRYIERGVYRNIMNDLQGRLDALLNYEDIDDDGDGVSNLRDKCPNTQGRFIDKNGCDCAQKNCEQFKGFQCQEAFVREIDPVTNNHIEKPRAVCVEVVDETPYDLREALRDVQMANRGDRRFIAEYPEHLVGADSRSLKGDASDLTVFFQRFGNGLTILAGSLAVIMIVVNGFMMVVSVGDTDTVGKAKSGLIWSLVALLLIIMAYVIVKTVISVSYSGQEFDVPPETNQPVQTQSVDHGSDEEEEAAEDQEEKSSEEQLAEIDQQIEDTEKEVATLESEIAALEAKGDAKCKKNLFGAGWKYTKAKEDIINPLTDEECQDIERQIQEKEDQLDVAEDTLKDLRKQRWQVNEKRLEEYRDSYKDITDKTEKQKAIQDQMDKIEPEFSVAEDVEENCKKGLYGLRNEYTKAQDSSSWSDGKCKQKDTEWYQISYFYQTYEEDLKKAGKDPSTFSKLFKKETYKKAAKDVWEHEFGGE